MRIHTTLATLTLLPALASAHVPWLEEKDYSAEAPLEITEVTNSKALNARLEPAGDVDYYHIRLDQPTRLVVTSDIPFCPEYREFSVAFALIGPGLPAPDAKLPVALPKGTGAVVVRDVIADAAKRNVYFEPRSGRLTWTGPVLKRDAVPPGDYQVIYWNEQGRAGDYIGVIGETDIFTAADRAQAKRILPLLDHGKNLMVKCDPTAPDADERRKKLQEKKP